MLYIHPWLVRSVKHPDRYTEAHKKGVWTRCWIEFMDGHVIALYEHSPDDVAAILWPEHYAAATPNPEDEGAKDPGEPLPGL